MATPILETLQAQQRDAVARHGQPTGIGYGDVHDRKARELGCTTKIRRYALGGVYCGTDYFYENGREAFYTMTGV